MGQRGMRLQRRRCQYVDPKTGVQCSVQVKRPGRRHCGVRHAALARRKETRVVEPGALAKAREAARLAVEEVQGALLAIADDGRVQVDEAMPIVARALARRYTAGYHSAFMTYSKRARLRLTASRDQVTEFVNSAFGKQFLDGSLTPEALDEISFVGGKTGRRKVWLTERRHERELE